MHAGGLGPRLHVWSKRLNHPIEHSLYTRCDVPAVRKQQGNLQRRWREFWQDLNQLTTVDVALACRNRHLHDSQALQASRLQ